jgi:hypothetical protein
MIMSLFTRFKSSYKKNSLFNFNFTVRRSVGKHKIDLEFITQPNQELLIAEFIFRIKHDEELWHILYDNLTKELSPESVIMIENHLKDLYAKYMVGVKSVQAAETALSDEPLISPLVKV